METLIRYIPESRYGFRCGEWARVVGAARITVNWPDQEPIERWCYVVQFLDGVRDYWPVAGDAAHFEFQEV